MLRLERLLFTGALFARLTNLFPLPRHTYPASLDEILPYSPFFFFLEIEQKNLKFPGLKLVRTSQSCRTLLESDFEDMYLQQDIMAPVNALAPSLSFTNIGMRAMRIAFADLVNPRIWVLAHTF